MKAKRFVATLAIVAAGGCGDDGGSGGSGTGGDDTTSSTTTTGSTTSGSTTSGSTTSGSTTTTGSTTSSTSSMMAECEFAADCDDDDACTVDTCNAGVCAYTPLDVDDDNACTDDSCNPQSGAVHVMTNVDDGNACTADTCAPMTGVAHTPIDRADMDLCTIDICDPTTGVSNFQASVLFQEDFADNAAGWTLDTEWAIGATASNPGGDPATDHSPSADNGVAAVGLGTNYATGLHGFYYLTSPVFDGSAANGEVVLSYWRWLNSDYPNYVTNVVEVFDGSTWQPVWTQPNVGEFILDSPDNANNLGQTGGGWQRVELNVTALANAGMQVRFGFNVGQAGAYALGGWTIDDLEIVNRAAAADDDMCTSDGCDSQAGSTYTPVALADAVACTVDSCDPDLGIVHLPDNAACNDNIACTQDTCNVLTGCTSTPNNAACNDSNVCTTDTCGAGGCTNTPVVSPPLLQPHNKCTTGGPLVGGNCNGADNQIIANICAVDSFCCNNSWDSTCVNEVFSVGDSKVCAASQGTCSHTLCTTGPALVANCDASFGDCVDQICAVDSFCCTNSWDSACVAEVSSVCGLNCN
jgi:hypothetical protein